MQVPCYVSLWAASSHRLPAPPPWLLCVAAFIIGQGAHLQYIAALLQNAENFPPHHRGKAVGFLAALVGMGGVALTVIYEAFHRAGRDPEFFLLEASVVGVACVLGSFLVRPATPAAALPTAGRRLCACGAQPPQASKRGFVRLPDAADGDDVAPRASDHSRSSRGDDTGDGYDGDEDLFGAAPTPGGRALSFAQVRDVTGRALLRSVDFWLLVVVFLFEDGTAVMHNNKLGTVTHICGGNGGGALCDRTRARQVTFSFCNSLGRPGGGWVSDRFHLRFSRCRVLFFTAVGMGLAHTAVAVAPNQVSAGRGGAAQRSGAC